MAIKSNDSNVEVAGGGVKLYSGLANFNVIAVNPTMAELHELGIMVKQDPNYYVELSGIEYFKLTFWIKNDDLTTRFDILMNGNERVSQSGKHQWLNAVGQSTWSDGEPEYDWYKKEGLRKALVGEETLINFVKRGLTLLMVTMSTLSLLTRLSKAMWQKFKLLLKFYQVTKSDC